MHNRMCTPVCKHFRCTRGYLKIKYSKQGKKIAVCSWVGDLCTGSKCKFASCSIGKLRSDGSCGLYTHRPTKQIKPQTSYKNEIEEPDRIPLPIKDKLLKKLEGKSFKKFK
ncbi:MAG: hypothetical protein ACP6IU_12455 [Candidatus Asgardarchaeia archaeon]